ncbi:hypothetical protein CR513_07656, partial [Mucuna pruriens]
MWTLDILILVFKELHKVELLETLCVTDYKLEENQLQQQKVANNEINTCEISCNSTVSSALKESGTSFQMDSPSPPAAQNMHLCVGKRQYCKLHSIWSDDERRHSRSMLGPDQHHGHVEETVITNASDTAEDVVEMDYAQPHRKPPIHNEKP